VPAHPAPLELRHCGIRDDIRAREQMRALALDAQGLPKAADELCDHRHAGFETQLLKWDDVGEGLEEIRVTGWPHAA
jgi:hypothetical protein